MEDEGGRSDSVKGREVRATTTTLEDQEPLTIKQLLLDLEYGKDLVDYIMSRDEDGDSNGSGANIVNDRDRDNASTNNGGDNKDDVLC